MEQRREPHLHDSFTHKQARLIRSQVTSFAKPMTQSAASTAQQSEPNQNCNQGNANIRDRLKGCFLADSKTFLFALVAIVYLIVSIIRFFGWTGDTTMLDTLLRIVGVYAGLPGVQALLPWGK